MEEKGMLEVSIATLVITVINILILGFVVVLAVKLYKKLSKKNEN